MTRLRKFLSSYSFLGAVRYLRLRLSGKELLVTGTCQTCGKCCRKINLEGDRGWLRSEKDFAAMLKHYPQYARFRICGKDEQGFLQFSCSWINSDGLCRDHKNRLPLCSSFPDKSLYFCGGTLPSGCGYQIREVRPFDRFLSEELKKREE